MFLGRNRFMGGNRPIPNGMQRFLNKKGINSQEDLFNRLQYAPRVSFRRTR